MDPRKMVQLYTALCVFLAVQQQLVLGCLHLAGQDVLFPATAPTATVSNGFSRRQLIITPDLAFSCFGTVNKWHAYFDGESSSLCFVEFQVWRPQDNSGCQTGVYDLVGRNSFESIAIDANLYGQFVPSLAEVISVEPGDVAGVYVRCPGSNAAVSVQTNPLEVGTSSSVDIIARNVLSNLMTADTCSADFSSVSSVPLITVNVTQAVTMTMIPTTAPADAVTTPTTSPAIETTPPVTTLDNTTLATTDPVTTLSTTSATDEQTSTMPATTAPMNDTASPDTESPSTTDGLDSTTSQTPTVETTDSAGGNNSQINQGTTPVPPASEEGVSLTTLILAVVLTLVGSTACVVATVLLYRCWWRRACKKKRAGQLAARNNQALNNPSYEMERYRSETLSDNCKEAMEKEEAGLYEPAAEPYEEPLTAHASSKAGAVYSHPLSSMKGRPLPEAKEDVYEVPLGALGQRQDNVYSNIPKSSQPQLSSSYDRLVSHQANTLESEYMTPKSTPAKALDEDEDYCDMSYGGQHVGVGTGRSKYL